VFQVFTVEDDLLVDLIQLYNVDLKVLVKYIKNRLDSNYYFNSH
jgi:hypothetical protein